MNGGMLVINLNGAPGAPGAIDTTVNDQLNVNGSALLNGNLTINYNNPVPIMPGTSLIYTVVTTTGGFVTPPGVVNFENFTFNKGALNYTATGAPGNGGLDFEVTISPPRKGFSAPSAASPRTRPAWPPISTGSTRPASRIRG